MATLRRMVLSAAMIVCAVVPAMVHAGSVFLNGVRIDGVTNQKFEKCTVTIDAKGDIYIDAPGYAVQGAEAATQAARPAVAAPAAISRRYFLIKEENRPGMAQYDIDIFINSVWFKRLRSNGEQEVIEITDKLRPGPNVIHLAATKNIGKERKSFSKQDYIRIIIGEGNMGGRNVMIDNPLIDYKRTAYETQNFNDEFNITAR
ncbi:MAG: hypothetical protein D6806_05175 [Deltaproteobacteria bacterium]|nr:MAG: hypothetical protein D6806_05175 [Deltaproteobacteria bacterium]